MERDEESAGALDDCIGAGSRSGDPDCFEPPPTRPLSFDGLSTYELIRTMLLAGYRLRGTFHGHVVVEDDERVVFAPVCETLSHQEVLGVLATAAVSPERFATLRGRLTNHDTWPDLS